MSAKPKHRDAIVRAAMTLFRRQGYAATGLNDIVAMSGAPKGSLYHYFPRGKASIAETTVTKAGDNLAATLKTLSIEHKTAGRLVRAYAGLLSGWMAQSRFTAGSSITTTLLEMAPADKAVTKAGRAAFAAWRGFIAPMLVAQGCAPSRAERLAGLVVSALEGALIQARVECSADILQQTAVELEGLLDGASAPPHRRGARAAG
jgi:TetR/AcrR family transcriptional regulator, lmrAB and yxaGH operons repressor